MVERVPQVLPVQPAPESVHRAPRLRRSLVTVAVNFCVPPGSWTMTVVGETVTVIPVCARTSGTQTRAIAKRTARTTILVCQDAWKNRTGMGALLVRGEASVYKSCLWGRPLSGWMGAIIVSTSKRCDRTSGHCSKLPGRTGARRNSSGGEPGSSITT